MTKNLAKVSNSSILGLDIGNALLKSSTGIILDSKITTIEPFEECNKLVLGGKTYWIGQGDYDTTYNKVKKPAYITMLYALLALSTETIHNRIAVGLPLGQYSENKEALVTLILKNNQNIIEINGEEKSLVIDDIFVFPEGVSTLEDKEESIIIDLGGLTTDCALVVNEKDKRKIKKPVSIPIGTITLYTELINRINSKYSLNLKIDDAERILKNGLTLDGKKESIDFALETYESYFNTLMSSLQANYDLRTNPISLTGGGANILHEQLKARLGDGLTMQKEPLFANANAFYELGCSLWE